MLLVVVVVVVVVVLLLLLLPFPPEGPTKEARFRHTPHRKGLVLGHVVGVASASSASAWRLVAVRT